MLQWENDLTSYQEKSVTAAFEALFSELDRNSARFLKLLSFLDPERIPLNVLVEGAKRLSQQDALPTAISSRHTHIALKDPRIIINNPVTDSSNSSSISPDFQPLFALILSPIQLKVAVSKLQRLSLVEHLFYDGQSYLRIHDLVQYMIGERAKKEASYREWLRSAVSLVCRAFSSVEEPELPQSWPECERFMPHLHSLNEKWCSVHGVSLELAKAHVEMAKYLNSRGRYHEAEAMCKRSVESYEKECGTEHQDTLDAVHILARTYFLQGRYYEAEAAGERILTGRKKILGADHTDTLDSTNTLALVYSAQGRFSEAAELFEGALAGFERNLGPDPRSTFSAMDNLAQVYQGQGRLSDSEQLLRRTLAGKEDILGPDDTDTLTTVHNLAQVYRLQNRYAEAEELYKRTLLALQQKLGSTHPDTLTTISSLAQLYQSQARYSEAEEHFQRVFAGRMQALGVSHPSTSRTATRLADFYRSQGRGSEADAVLNTLPDW
jgi:tetratricopeptide (TPR) repeat protein